MMYRGNCLTCKLYKRQEGEDDIVASTGASVEEKDGHSPFRRGRVHSSPG